MHDKKMLYRPAPLLQYRSGRSANEAHGFLQETMKEHTPSQVTCFGWNCKFNNGDESLEDSRRTGGLHTRVGQLVLLRVSRSSLCTAQKYGSSTVLGGIVGCSVTEGFEGWSLPKAYYYFLLDELCVQAHAQIALNLT
ncbi:unnamed protein product [Heligmosomoides polygyrus]|uniref:HTH_48 domain-containing protein n=1 Tax=Heligmosomoides polygyrus TaxID=6339 RepID=A0A183G5V9_HELPZ|nr:unnamed protein product [Heligmosomoides polygyrus]